MLKKTHSCNSTDFGLINSYKHLFVILIKMDGDNCDIFREFISSVKEYNQQRSEVVGEKLQRYLQVIP